MKRILSAGLLVLSAFAMAGCEDLPGVLVVTKNFSVLVKGKNKTVTEGQHETSLDFKKNRVVATIKMGDDSLKVELSVPQGAQIPSNGSFELKSAQTGQPFDVLGSMQTTVTDTERQSRYEGCQKQDYQTICDQNGCRVVPVIRQGTRYVEFFYRHTSQVMQFNMTPVGEANKQYAYFNGDVRQTEKIVTNEGMCF